MPKRLYFFSLHCLGFLFVVVVVVLNSIASIVLNSHNIPRIIFATTYKLKALRGNTGNEHYKMNTISKQSGRSICISFSICCGSALSTILSVLTVNTGSTSIYSVVWGQGGTVSAIVCTHVHVSLLFGHY